MPATDGFRLLDVRQKEDDVVGDDAVSLFQPAEGDRVLRGQGDLLAGLEHPRARGKDRAVAPVEDHQFLWLGDAFQRDRLAGDAAQALYRRKLAESGLGEPDLARPARAG